MNHLETLTAEWLNYKSYFVRTAVRVGKLPRGGYAGELDVVAFHPTILHFLHVECAIAAGPLTIQEEIFRRKFEVGRKHARDLFSGMELPTALDQIVVHGGLIAAGRHRNLGGGRLVTFQELTAEIIAGIPYSWRQTVPESFPLLRTLQFAKIVFGNEVEMPEVRLIPKPIET
jgi:hypothetical protein